MKQIPTKFSHPLLLVILIASLTSCFHVYFDQPQPKNGIQLFSVPQDLQGAWIDEGDTTYIGENGLYMFDYDSINQQFKKEGFTLSDSVLLFKAGDYYVVNVTDDHIFWEVEILHRHENGDIYFYYPKTAPYFGKNLRLHVDSISQEFEPVMLNDSIGRDRRVLFKKSLKMKHVMTRNAVYYRGQFSIKDIEKVVIPENLERIYRQNGTIEHKMIVTDESEQEIDTPD